MINPEIKKIQKLLTANNLRGAEKLCRNAVRRNSYDVNMIALLGAVLLKSGQLNEASHNLRRAIELAPTFAKPHEDLAVVHLRRDEFKQAESQFRRAIELQPDMGSAWMGLVHSLWMQDEFAQAGSICARILARNPGNLNAMRYLARIRSQQGRVHEAGQLLQRIVDKTPDSVSALSDLAQFNADQHQYPRAIELFRRAAKIQPQNPKLHFSLASLYILTGFPAQALDACDAGLALNPTSSRGRSVRVHALRTLGRTEEAIVGYKANIQENIDSGESWWSLASLRTYPFSDGDIEAMQLLRSVANTQDRLFIDFALGKAMDDREQYDAAWKHYEAANHARRKQVDYDGVQFKSQIDAIMSCVDSNLISAATASTKPIATPIFILGMPRSGSTLIEQILACHSMVEATTELPYMTALGEHNLIAEKPGIEPKIAGLGADRLKAIGDSYMQAVQLHRSAESPYFIDKMPDNFQFAGLIAMALPGARIIDARRNPMDTSVGNFRQWFGNGKEYSYDLNELGNRYLQYLRIMKHWDEVMPGKILRVDYEDVVVDTEVEIRRILSWCGLPWEDGCVRFYESDRVVTTASSEQVRQPIYKSGIGFWKNYQAHLEELTGMLQAVIKE